MSGHYEPIAAPVKPASMSGSLAVDGVRGTEAASIGAAEPAQRAGTIAPPCAAAPVVTPGATFPDPLSTSPRRPKQEPAAKVRAAPSPPAASKGKGAPAAPSQPRYLQIAGELTRAIASGRYPVGARLPTELELCERFEISRFTAREAVRMLSTAGLVTRRQRAGTVVIAKPDEARYTHDAASVRDLFQYAIDTELKLMYVGKVALDKARAAQFGAAAGDEWIYAIGIRLESTGSAKAGLPASAGAKNRAGASAGKAGADAAAVAARPICVTRLFLNPALEGIEARLREGRMAVYALIEREYRVTIQRVEQDLQGAVLDADDAANLGAKPGAPALRIVRRYYDADDRLLEVAENVHPADRFTYRMHLRK
jgi:DNA-binding GntR family transcriptional regulator